MLNSTCTKVSYLLCTSLIHSSTSTLHSLLAIFTSETKLGSGGRWGARLTVPAGEVVVWSSAIAPDLDPEQRYHRHHCGVWSAIWKIVLNASQILHNYYNVSKKCIVYYVNLLYKHIWLKSDITQRNFHPSIFFFWKQPKQRSLQPPPTAYSGGRQVVSMAAERYSLTSLSWVSYRASSRWDTLEHLTWEEPMRQPIDAQNNDPAHFQKQ